MKTDYLIIGSGLAALSFGSLMAKAGKRVKIIEAHYLPGGFGHTFELGGYKFNAQLHYVWNCGEGRSVNTMLKTLGLDKEIAFCEYDPNGFDHMRMPGYSLDIPYDYDVLIERLQKLFPQSAENLRKFVLEVKSISKAIDDLPRFFSSEWRNPAKLFPAFSSIPKIPSIYKFRRATLQDVFDHFQLPLEAQTLIGLQWPDFMLPPNRLSFFAWVLLFSGYCRGAYYPGHHYEHVINSLVEVIEENAGEIVYQQKAVQFIVKDNQVKGVIAEPLENGGGLVEHFGETVICNMDPRRAAEMIGFQQFSSKVRKQLNYEYSPSNFMAYCVVEGIDLQDYGFGKWNLFHTEQPDLNKAFDDMCVRGDYSKPSFAVTVPGLLTDDTSDCGPGKQIIEFLTVADYDRFLDLKLSSPAAYRRKKQEIFDAILDVMEKYYVPDIRKHLVFKITGSPTTNERYCWSPSGNSYGSNMTPENIGPGRLTHKTSLKNFYFCNASSGYAGFAGTIWTGCRLYERLSGDSIL